MPGTLLGAGNIDINKIDIFPVLIVWHSSGAHDVMGKRKPRSSPGEGEGKRTPMGG